MRLLNTSTIELEFFVEKNIPEYVMLSHTWSQGEVSFQEFPQTHTKDLPGYKKIKLCCDQAQEDGFSWAWVDTCCIDKTSSSELSEAINSMYQWYQNAQVCYTYLADVRKDDEDPDSDGSMFRSSRWFTRGWTLQELLAPQSVVFYDMNWKEIGTKSSLQNAISMVTSIPTSVLLINHPGELSIAQRISWASKRETTRSEDMAYCLMGLLGVSMPTLYGEGGVNAFSRLQQEVMKSSDDQTIFAWKAQESMAHMYTGLFARSPADFVDSGNVRRSEEVADAKREPYTLTNAGVRIHLPLISSVHEGEYLALLDCQLVDGYGPLGIYVRKERGDGYIRVHSDKVYLGRKELISGGNGKRTTLYVKQPDPSRFDLTQWMRPQPQYFFAIKELPIRQVSNFELAQVFPPENWNGWGEGMRLTMGGSGTSGAMLFQSATEKFIVMLGVHNYNVWSDIVTKFGEENLEEIWLSYYKDGGRGGQLWKNLDRIMVPLGDGRLVSVVVRKGIEHGQKTFFANIYVTTSKSTRVTQLEIRKSPQYTFTLEFGTSALQRGISILELYPQDFWETKNPAVLLHLASSGTSGLIMLQEDKNREKIAVMLGIHNYEVWSDIVTSFGQETAPDIRDSYYRDNGRGHMLWKTLKETSVKLKDGKTLWVTTRGKLYLGENGLYTTISVT